MNWIERYRSKLRTAGEAVKIIESGQRVYIHPGCAMPEVLADAMCQRYAELEDVEVIHLLTVGRTKYSIPEMEGHFRHNALFIGKNVREAVNDGRADFTPVFLSEIPDLFYRGILPIDVALIHVSPPDEHGFCSFGLGVECTKPATEVAKVIIAQVNPNMPRTLGDCFIHVDKLTYCVEVDVPLKELPQVEKGISESEQEVYQKIGKNIAGLIEDGSTLQLGIGSIPDAVLSFLHNKKHLGLHTEMFSDGVVKLVENGIITNEKKTLHTGKIVVSFVLGTRPLFDFIDNNPLIEFHPSNYVNNPFIISRNEKMVAINSAIEVDVTGQVCADSIGSRFYSGFGGQVDFIRGASRSKGGKPIIALPSTARNGSISRIVPRLTEGAGVTTTRGDVHYVITEFGVADLYGKTIRERVKALIDVAHPEFQEELERFAVCQKYFPVSSDIHGAANHELVENLRS
ncbi:MAG TPA: acetyl-CoA hydrolase/transferase C-terminal domain-containing protein [Bacteroidota bacterium]|nr:acetyl-CoA hydrolase/transferase C-terminal domain-containing protein [Bacteroidota bacterium]